MQSRILSKWSLPIVAITGIACAAMIMFSMSANLGSHTPEGMANDTSVYTISLVNTSSTFPVRLKIPRIRVDATIESVGLTVDGAVGIPKNPREVAWFNLGPHPGEVGSAIITGHYGPWKGGVPTVFNNLYRLRKNDKIYIKDDLGVTTTFVVRVIQRYDEKASVAGVFGSKDGKSHLNLITCEGVWSKANKSYSNRLIIFTDKE